jgi:hypothetical protein
VDVDPDRTALRPTPPDTVDESHHLGKVRVAGSNPVFRSRGRSVAALFRGSSDSSEVSPRPKILPGGPTNVPYLETDFNSRVVSFALEPSPPRRLNKDRQLHDVLGSTCGFLGPDDVVKVGNGDRFSM